MVKRDFSGGVEARLHHKDFAILLDEAMRLGAPLPVAAQVWQQLNALMSSGWGDRILPSCCVSSSQRWRGWRRERM